MPNEGPTSVSRPVLKSRAGRELDPTVGPELTSRIGRMRESPARESCGRRGAFLPHRHSATTTTLTKLIEVNLATARVALSD
ncbi:hypothetical protein EVAR_44888_1 [Eumeta japonica]|uniref:Uncharacterized protein n=1 Tax=Eumeta variegata TaxID=151549 RepID=A0A4C1XNF3_EUMVA|nr:hypothetical protein EVAR_44888_1 [Eumeta japonica]